MARHVLEGLRITARCEDCGVEELAFLVGREGHVDSPQPLYRAMSEGWAKSHKGHRQVVTAEPGTLVVSDDADC